MEFIKLTTPNGHPVWIVVSQIVALETPIPEVHHRDVHTVIIHEGEGTIGVRENPDDIAAKLGHVI